MDNLIQVAGVPIITALVYGTMALYRHVVNGKESLVRLIPVIATVLGAILGVVAFYAVPGIVPAENIFVAILIGGASGAAATGSHQIFKQLAKDKTEDSSGETNAGD